MTEIKLAARRKVVALVVVMAGAVLLVLPFTSPGGAPLIFLFLGRFHPLVLHFPIVLSLLALLVEVSRRFFFRRITVVATEVLLGAATVSSWVTIAAGYFLYASGEYSGDVILQHFWAGTLAGTGLSVALGLLLYYHTTGRLYGIFMGTLLLTNGAVAYASHLGGTVTHGQEYLVEYLHMMQAADPQTARSDEELLLYADMVAPVLEARCVSCHNGQRAKGGLAMDGYSKLFGAGDSNRPAVVRGSLSKSEAIARMHLPLDDDEHMPPSGKSPLTTDELTLLKFWIAQGASDTARVWTVRGNDSMRVALDRLVPELRKYQLRTAVNRAKDAQAFDGLSLLAPSIGLQVSRDSLAEGTRLQLTTAMPPRLMTGEHMRELAPYYLYFSKVSLVSSGVEDDLLYYIAQMSNVRSLLLQKNAIDGSGLVYLSTMPGLEVLNLSFTRVDDRHALELLKFPTLKKVYLYRTNVSPDVIEAIKRYRPGLEILEEEGPYW
jgi:uncharacterized membrane protein